MSHSIKHSHKRDRILACLQQTKSHPDAEWIYHQLRAEDSSISLATVYRNLISFRENGTIASLGTIDGHEHYDATTEPHAHFICRHCSSILDLPMPPLEALEGCVVDSCSVIYRGICAKCQENISDSSECE